MITIKEILAEDCWPIRHEVMWPDRDVAYVKLPEDHEGTHYGLFKDNRLITIISLFSKNGEVQFRKFACVRDKQGKGYGGQLFRFMLDEIAKSQVKRVFCNARIEKTGFYENFGFKKTSTFFKKGGKSYVVMEKSI